jgi:hypothetical protein
LPGAGQNGGHARYPVPPSLPGLLLAIAGSALARGEWRGVLVAALANDGEVRELMHDGAPTACVRDAAFAYVDAFTAHVNLGFFHGASLADPAGLLEGTGRFMRHVKLRPGVPVDDAALHALVTAAYRDILVRLVEAGGDNRP